jgi:hypothetical protein
LSYFLFVAYLLLCCWLLCKIKFIVNAGISKKIIVILFVTKVFAGVFAGWLYHTQPGADTWQYHNDALKEYYLLFTHPKEYFTNLFVSNYNDTYGGFFQSTNSYWNDLKNNVMIKLVSVLHICSFGNYYVNVIIYNFLIFFGNVALFKVFSSAYRRRSILLVVVCFLLPSFLFFSSTIHKDGLIISAIGIILYIVDSLLSGTKWNAKKIIVFILAILIVFMLRNFVIIALVPAIGGWIIAKKVNFHPLYLYSAVYLSCIILFFCIGKIIPAIDLPQAVVNKQESFFGLEKARSFIETDTLHPSFKSFAINAPQALNHSLLRPYISDGKRMTFLYPLAFELLIYEIILFVFIFFRKKNNDIDLPFILFGIFFSTSLLLITGYITPVLGALVRYRSIYLPFLIAPLLMSINYKKFLSVLSIKK